MARISSKVSGSGRTGFSAELRIDGLEETIAALKALEPEVLKAMQKEIREAVTDVARKASTSFARTGHGAGDYRVRSQSRGKRTGMSVKAAGKEEAIFELAGTKGRSRTRGPITPQGAAMVRWLDRFAKPGRFLWSAFDAQKGELAIQVEKSIREAEHVIQRRLDAAGGGS